MHYPYMLIKKQLNMSPIFPGLDSNPLILDLSIQGSFLKDLEPGDQKAFQKKMEALMENRFEWGLSFYLENRKSLLSTCQQMVEEQRYFHLGLDIIVKSGTAIQSPLEAVVKDSGYEEGKGNFGGYILLEHKNSAYDTFYTLFGHLDPKSLKDPGTKIEAGSTVAQIGEYSVNGNWFDHTHMQILTEKALSRGMQFKGYCKAEDLAVIDSLCPSPVPLFLMCQKQI